MAAETPEKDALVASLFSKGGSMNPGNLLHSAVTSVDVAMVNMLMSSPDTNIGSKKCRLPQRKGIYLHENYHSHAAAILPVLCSQSGAGIVAELYRWDPLGGLYRFAPAVILPSGPYTWAKMPFFGKKSLFFSGPKMVQKWVKSGQIWPKLPQNRRNKSRGPPENTNESQLDRFEL